MTRRRKSARYWTMLMVAAVALAAVSFGSDRPIFGGIYLACAVTCGWLAAQRRREDAQEPKDGPPEK